MRWVWNANSASDRKSTRLNSSHTEIYTLSLHDALPILDLHDVGVGCAQDNIGRQSLCMKRLHEMGVERKFGVRSEEHTSELQSHRDLHSFPTRRSSDLRSS